MVASTNGLAEAAHGTMAHMPEVIFGWDGMIVSSAILVLAYVFIISEKINRAVIALLGAGAMIFLGVLNQELAVQGIDFNTIFLTYWNDGYCWYYERHGRFSICCDFIGQIGTG